MRRAAVAVLLVGAVVVLGLLTQVLFSSLIAPQFLIRKIVVHGAFPVSTVELKRIAGLDGDDHVFDVDTQAIAERIAAHPTVHSASVRTRIPGTLEITVTPRRPLATSLTTIEGRSVPVVFDASGVIIDVGPGTPPELPIVSGLRFAQPPRPGITLPQELLPAVSALAAIRDDDSRLYGLISEVVVSTTDAGALDLSFYPSIFPVAVRLGTRLDAEVIRHALVALDVLEADGTSPLPHEIDLRGGEAVYVQAAAPRSQVAAPHTQVEGRTGVRG